MGSTAPPPEEIKNVGSRSSQSKIFRASRERAAHLLTKVLHDLDGWKFISEKRDVKFFKKKTTEGNSYSINAITKITASLDEIMHALYCSDTTSFCTLMSQLHEDKFADASVMCNLPPRNDNSGAFKEKCGFKWLCFKPFTTMGKPRDYCVVDYCAVRAAHSSKNTTADSNDRIGIQLFYSVKRPECPDHLKTHGVERTHLEPSGFVIYPTSKPGVVEVIFNWSVRDDQSMNRSFKKTILGMAQCICRLESTLLALRISKSGVLKPKNWVQDKARNKCFICQANFGPFRRRHHCRICGDIACSKCSSITAVKLPVLGISQVRICTSCTNDQDRDARLAPTPIIDEEFNEMEEKPARMEIVGRLSEGMGEFSGIPSQNRFDEDGFQDEDDILTEEMQKMKNVVDVQPFHYQLDFDWKNPWPKAPIPNDDGPRVHKLRSCEILDTGDEEEFELMVQCARETFNAKYSFVSFLDEKREWLKACRGMKASNIPRDSSFCAHVVMSFEVTIVLDTLKDERFANNPFVKKAPYLRFYCGFPLVTMDGFVIGCIAVADTKPRTAVTTDEIRLLQKLSTHAISLVEERGYSIATISSETQNPGYNAKQMENTLASLLQKSYKTEMEVERTKHFIQQAQFSELE